MNTINTLFGVLALLSTLSSGVLAGALLTEAYVLLPYWRKMHPKDFLSLHHKMGPSLFRFFAPITVAGTLLPVATFIAAILTGSKGIYGWGVSAAAGMAMLGIYFAYFKAANEGFASGAISTEDLPAELSQWAYWHHIRTAIAIAGLVAALWAFSGA